MNTNHFRNSEIHFDSQHWLQNACQMLQIMKYVSKRMSARIAFQHILEDSRSSLSHQSRISSFFGWRLLSSLYANSLSLSLEPLSKRFDVLSWTFSTLFETNVYAFFRSVFEHPRCSFSMLNWNIDMSEMRFGGSRIGIGHAEMKFGRCWIDRFKHAEMGFGHAEMEFGHVAKRDLDMLKWDLDMLKSKSEQEDSSVI